MDPPIRFSLLVPLAVLRLSSWVISNSCNKMGTEKVMYLSMQQRAEAKPSIFDYSRKQWLTSECVCVHVCSNRLKHSSLESGTVWSPLVITLAQCCLPQRCPSDQCRSEQQVLAAFNFPRGLCSSHRATFQELNGGTEISLFVKPHLNKSFNLLLFLFSGQ